MSKRASDAPTYVGINRNFLNYPLARDIRCETDWKWLKGRECWLCRYADDRLRVYLPGDVDDDLRRCPTPFDLSVLWLLIATAQMQDRRVISFPSLSAIVRLLGASVETRNRRKVDDALDLWSIISVRFERWYAQTHEECEPKYKRRTFAPPIRSIEETRSGGLQIKMRDAWITPDRGFYAKIPLPLPRSAAAQNLVLYLMTARRIEVDDGKEVTRPMWRSTICRIIGVTHKTGYQVLAGAIKNAQKWFERHGGNLDQFPFDGKLAFEIKPPKVRKPRQPRSKPIKRIKPTRRLKLAKPTTPIRAARKGREVYAEQGRDLNDRAVKIWLYSDTGKPVEDHKIARIKPTSESHGVLKEVS